MTRSVLAITLFVFAFVAAVHGQSSAPGVPRFIPASGVLLDHSGKPLNGSNVKVTFSVYANADDVDALWSETLKLHVTAGRYDALIGSSATDGIPATVFAAGDARWLEVTADKAATPPRSLLVSVPYALTADDSAKLGGLPASAFVLKEGAGVPSAATSATPSGWKAAVADEAVARAEADSALQNSLDGEAHIRETKDLELNAKVDTTKGDLDAKIESTKGELHSKIDATKGELDSKIGSTKGELDSKIDSVKGELNAKIDTKESGLHSKIDATKQELNSKIAFETAKVTTDQEAKLLALKNELKQDSSLKVDDLDQKKTGKEEFEFEKIKKGQEIDDLKQKKVEKQEFENEKNLKNIAIGKKLDKELYDLDKLQKDADINDLKQKKLEKHEFETEKLAKNAALVQLDVKKVEKTDFEAEKTSKQQQIDAINAKLIAEKDRVDTLAKFVVSFAREPNGDPMQNHWMCPDDLIATGIVGQTADPVGTASPFCANVSGATVRADGKLAATFSGPFAVPGLDGVAPTFELTCPAAHAVVGIAVDGEGNMSARCRRLFSAIEVNSAASVPVPALPPGPTCPADQTAAGIVRFAATIEVVCR